MTDFSLFTTWHIPAPIESVWPCLVHTETWPSWWKYVKSVEEMESGAPTGVFNKRRFRWRTRLPYHLNLDLTVTQIIPYRRITVAVQGDLSGTGRCRVSADSERTTVEFHWQVKTCKPWMDRISLISRPLFEWNHTQVMKQGELSLVKYLSALKN